MFVVCATRLWYHACGAIFRQYLCLSAFVLQPINDVEKHTVVLSGWRSRLMRRAAGTPV